MAQAGAAPGVLGDADGEQPQPRSAWPYAPTLLLNKYLFSNQSDADPAPTPWHRQAMRAGYHTAAIPIRRNDVVVGALNLYAREAEYFGAYAIPTLEEVALDISFALDNYGVTPDLITFAKGVNSGYVPLGGVIVSDKTVRRAHGWREKVHTAARFAQRTWHEAPLFAKIAAVVCLIASQVYLHFFLVVFPIAFLVPAVRKIWVRAADMLFGSWYWKTFGSTHRAIVAGIRSLPFMRALFDAARLMRLRYLSAWRIWRYDPRYRDQASQARFVSLIEPWRLLRRGELDRYIGRPLLAGRERQRLIEAEASA